MASMTDSALPSSSTTLQTGTSTTTSQSQSQSQSQSAASKKWLGILDQVVDSVVIRLHRRDIRGSGVVALQTAELLRTVISKGRFTSVTQLLEQIRSVGKRLSDAQPIELSIGNIVRRVLHIVRHECAAAQKEQESIKLGDKKLQAQQINIDLSLSLHKLLDAPHASASQQPAYLNLSAETIIDLKQSITEEISLLMDEIKNGEDTIAEQAIEHIYAKEVIMTFGISKTVVAFLKEAAKFRKFEVVVAESAPSYEGQKMAVLLAEAGIETTVITDSAVFAIMPSVNKVIVGTHGVMANGGLIAHTGAHNIAVAAAHHSVPFVVVTGLHKLCPLYAFDQDTFNEHNAPSQILKFEQGFAEHVDVSNPAFDYVAPELINLFITNIGGHNPSYIYRLLAEYYDPQDYKL